MDLRFACGRTVSHGNRWPVAKLLVRRFYAEPSGLLVIEVGRSGASPEAFKVKLTRGSSRGSNDATIFDGWRGAIFWVVVERHGRLGRSPVKLVASARGDPYRGCCCD
jgi:hypothetical protein